MGTVRENGSRKNYRSRDNPHKEKKMKTSRNVRFVALFGTVAAFVIAIAIAAFGGPQIDASTTAPVGQPHDRWYVETRNQPVQRDRWYVEAKMQPAARDQWYIESKARPAATDKWYLDMPGAREHTILTSTAARDRWYTEAKAQPAARDRWYLDMPNTRKSFI